MADPVSFDSAHLFARIARDLAEQGTIDNTISRIVELAKVTVGCDVALACELRHGTRVRVRAATDSVARDELAAILAEVDEGVAHEALLTRSTVRVEDIRTDNRWPNYRRLIGQRALALRSALAFPLDLGRQDLGALVLYSNEPRYFSDELLDTGGVFADHAAISLDAATAVDKAENMQLAVESNRRIGMAMGILMAQHRIAEEQAFTLLRVASQNNRVKLRDIAEDVILTGAVPEWPSRRPPRPGPSTPPQLPLPLPPNT
ncbi:MAG TPA: GAF and ANTAR domain-containing protein [Jatrophihabitans sp.]|jgi:GAF domain-containing protein